MGQLHSPSAPSSHFSFSSHSEKIGQRWRGWWLDLQTCLLGRALLLPSVTAWVQHCYQCISMMCFLCSSMLCFDWCGFTKTRKEGTLKVGLHYQLVWHKEGRTVVWFAGTLYGSSTVSPHYYFSGKEVWTRYQSQAHTICAQRTNCWRILQSRCRWTTWMGPQCVPSTLFPLRGKLLQVQWCVWTYAALLHVLA